MEFKTGNAFNSSFLYLHVPSSSKDMFDPSLSHSTLYRGEVDSSSKRPGDNGQRFDGRLARTKDLSAAKEGRWDG
jgi:hypothetical protein